MKNQFIKIPASKKSLAMRTKVYGVGVNDADYMVNPVFNRKRVPCPYYKKWSEMLKRCYSKLYQDKRPTYIGCSVCHEWLLFSNFRVWMKAQNWENLELDKDIIKPGNKIYSPSACCFITRDLNALLNSHSLASGEHPQGVHYDKESKRYKAEVNVKGRSKNLGRFETPYLASAAYVKAKVKIISEFIEIQNDTKVINGLTLHAEMLVINHLSLNDTF